MYKMTVISVLRPLAIYTVRYNQRSRVPALHLIFMRTSWTVIRIVEISIHYLYHSSGLHILCNYFAINFANTSL